MRRLDKVLWNVSARVVFPEAKIVVLLCLYSDRNPIFFIGEAGHPPDRNLRPTRFEVAWLSREDYKIIWKDAAAKVDTDMVEIISTVSQKNILWNQNVFENIFKRKRRLESRILEIQNSNNYVFSSALQRRESQLTKELNQVLDQEESLWFQKARMDWIRDGDRNTRFYHNSALIKRNRNRIRFLKINGIWTDDSDILTDHITNFFSTLFCRSMQGDNMDYHPVPLAQKITTRQADSICRTTHLEEVKKAVFGIKKYGSPGPDEVLAVFYHHFWNDVGPAMTEMVNQALTNGFTHKSLLQTFVTLIPKKEVPD